MITIEPTIKIYDDEGNLSRAYDKAVDKMIDKTYDIDLEQFDFDEVANGKSKELDNLVVKLCKESGLGSKDIYTMLLDRFEAEYDVPVDFVVYLGKDWEDDFKESKKSARKSIKESSDMVERITSEIDKSYWIDKLIDDLDRHYESMEKAWLKNLDKLSDEDILGIIDDCMGKSKTLVGKSEMLKNKMIDDLSKAYDDYIDDIDRQIRIGKSEDEIKDMIETTLENDIKMYLKLAYNNKASSNYFMIKFAEDNLI